MLNTDAKLNPNLFNDDAEKLPTRKGFGEGLLLAAQNNESVVGLCADLTESTQMHLFRDAFPKRFIQIGVAEQNLVTVASGMAAMGKLPFVSSYAAFSPGRNWEQIRTTITYNDRPVIVVGSHSGVSVGPDGGTHQMLEDIALMRVLPNMVMVVPCDAVEAKKATLALAVLKKPAYLRLTREKTAVMTTDETPFEIGKAYTMYESVRQPADISPKKRVGFIACGPIVHQAILAAVQLESQSIYSTVINMHTIKPLDENALLELVKNVDYIVTVEEHQKAGGLGSTVAEFLSEKNPIKILRIGVQDTYGQSGNQDELMKHYGLDSEGIIKQVKDFI